MSWRTIVISQRCKLDLKMGKLVVRADEIKQVLLDEISIIIVENTAVSITACLLNEIALRITSVVRQYVSKLVFSSEFELVFSDEIDISTLLKILGVRFESSKGGLCEKLFDYFCVIRELYGERLFIVSNLFPLVDEGELQLFFKTVVEHDMMLLLIENADFSSDLVNKIVVDKDFCVI